MIKLRNYMEAQFGDLFPDGTDKKMLMLREDEPDDAVLEQFLHSGQKSLPVLDKEAKIIGVMDKVSTLRYLLEKYKSTVGVLETILNNTYDGIILVDKKGIITKINRAYLDFLGISEEDALGKHVTDVVENSRMHIVVETGKAEIGHAQRIRGKDTVVMRLPILKDGEVVGAVGKVMFRDVRELKTLAENLNLIESELKYYKTELHRLKGAKYSFENIIGNSEKISMAKQLAKQAAASDSTVLIYGESGTGKEIFAHAIHNYSCRRFGPFVRVNCGAIPGTLFESELFGYERGSLHRRPKRRQTRQI